MISRLLNKKGQEVLVGDKVLYGPKGDNEWTIQGHAAPHKPSSSGRVYVTDAAGRQREFFPTVFDLRIETYDEGQPVRDRVHFRPDGEENLYGPTTCERAGAKLLDKEWTTRAITPTTYKKIRAEFAQKGAIVCHLCDNLASQGRI